MPYVADNLKTTVTNSSGRRLVLSFLPPHGASLAAGESMTFYGTPTEVLGANQGSEFSVRRRALKSFEAALAAGHIVVNTVLGVPTLGGAPVFSAANYTFSLPENSVAGTVVGTVIATDPNGATGLVYSLAGTGVANFVINATTGAITVAVGAVLDFEGVATFNLLASVTDDVNPVSVRVTVNLTDVAE